MKLIVIAIAIAAIVGTYFYVRHLQNTNSDLEKDIVILDAKIADQNAAVQALKKEGDVRLAAAQKDLESAKVEASKGKAKARVIYKTAPSTPGNDCKSALDLINGNDLVSKDTLDLINGGNK